MDEKIKVLWAVDPFSKEKKIQADVFLEILKLYGERATVEPVYLSYIYPIDRSKRTLTGAFTPVEAEAMKKFEKIRKLLGIQKNLLPLKIVRQPTGLFQEKIDELIEYAQLNRASLIALSTHARSGMNRWLVGSFAEKLMTQSDVPLMVINPSLKSVKSLNSILFASDFTDESRLAFEAVVEFAKDTGLKVKLFHKIPPFVVSMTKVDAYYNFTLTQLLSDARRNAHQWIKFAKSAGVKVEFILEQSARGAVSESVLKIANQSPCVIALASEGTLLTQIFVGGSTRKVLRASRFPVWTIRPSVQRRKRTRLPKTYFLDMKGAPIDQVEALGGKL